MKNKSLKSFIIIVITLFCLMPFSYAETAIDDVVSDGDKFLNSVNTSVTTVDMSKLQNLSSTIYNIIFSIGMVIAVIVGTILGIKFMISSVEEKAKIQQILVVYVVGCCVLFGGFTIWKICMEILGNV